MRTAYSFSELGIKQVALSHYLGEKAAHAFYPPIRPLAECVQHKAASIAASGNCTRFHRKRIANLLRRQQPSPLEPAVAKSLEAAETDGYFLVSGQQVGICLGPLYTLIKAIALISLRDKLEAALPGYRFVPLFWADGMDHDFDEIRHAGFVSRDGQFEKVSISQPPGTAGRPASSIILSVGDIAAMAEMFNRMADCPYKEQMLALFTSSYVAGLSLTEAFCSLLSQLVSKHGLLVFDPENVEAKRLAVPLFVESLRRQEAEQRLLSAQNNAIAEAGGVRQVAYAAGETNLFLLSPDGVREKLICEGNSFSVKHSAAAWELSELAALAGKEPWRISFGALTRPLYQQALFPAVATLGGPGEIAYWAQMFPLFGLYELAEPLLVPRPTFTITNSRQRRLMERYSLDINDLFQPTSEITSRIARQVTPKLLISRLNEMEEAFISHSAGVRGEAAKLEASLAGVVETLGANFRKHIATVRRKVEQSVKQREVQLEVQASELRNWLAPEGVLQERSINSLAALAVYGPSLIDAIKGACEFPPAGHLVISL